MLSRSLPAVALAVVGALALAACNALTGADDLEVGDGNTGGAGQGAAGHGGDSTTTTTTGSGAGTTTTTSTSTSGGGGGGGPVGPVCGDGTCNGNESCTTCDADCGVCPPTCGNGTCDGGETCQICPGDCGVCPPACGDALCNGAETCATCPGDCGACPPTCGDAQCNGAETCQTCPGDCGQCAPSCGDGQCNGGETCQTCAADCGQCAPSCGDGSCNGAEDCASCAADCGQCAPGCGGAGPGTTPLDAEEQAFLGIINNYRAQNGLGALSACTSLNRAAQGHSEDMRDQDYFSHTGLDGSSPWDRACDACYALGCGPQTAMAENIAAGNSDAQATFTQWKNSPGHNANMLGASFTVIGIGRATGGGTYGSYWTNVFGGQTEASCN